MKRKLTKLTALAVALALVVTLFTACGGGGIGIRSGRYFRVKYPDEPFVEVKGNKLIIYKRDEEPLTWKLSMKDGVLWGKDDEENSEIPCAVFGDVLFLMFDWCLREGGEDNKPMNGRYVPRYPDAYYNYDCTYMDFDGDTLTTYDDYYNDEETGKWTLKNGVLSVEGDGRWDDEPCVVAGDVLVLARDGSEYVLEGSATQIADRQAN